MKSLSASWSVVFTIEFLVRINPLKPLPMTPMSRSTYYFSIYIPVLTPMKDDTLFCDHDLRSCRVLMIIYIATHN